MMKNWLSVLCLLNIRSNRKIIIVLELLNSNLLKIRNQGMKIRPRLDWQFAARRRPLVEDGATAGTGKALPARGADQGSLAAGHASTRLKVLVVLMETVDVVRVPAGETEIKIIKIKKMSLGRLLAHVIKMAILTRGDFRKVHAKLTFWRRKQSNPSRCSRSRRSCTAPEKKRTDTKKSLKPTRRSHSCSTRLHRGLKRDPPGRPGNAGTRCRRTQQSWPSCWRGSHDPETHSVEI